MITDPRGCGSEPWPVIFQRTTIHDSKGSNEQTEAERNHYGKRSANGNIVSARGQHKAAWLSFQASDWNKRSKREWMAHQVIYFNVSVVSQRVENPALFPSSCQQHRTILSGWICLLSSSLSLCCSLLCYCPTPRYNLAVLSFFLFCCHFLRFSLLVIFPFLTSYIISLFCFLCLSSISKFTFSLRGVKMTVNGEEGMVQQNIASFTFITNLTHNFNSSFYSRRRLGIHVGFAMLKACDSSCPLLWCSG